MPQSIKDRLLSKIKVGPKCWAWTNSKIYGYGQINIKGTPAYAHRVMWKLVISEIPEGMCVLHKCDNRECTNPDHLFLGTRTDNAQDKVNKGRQARGEMFPQTPFTQSQIMEIRNMEGTQKDIADQFGVFQSTISRIKNQRRWRHV